MNTLRFGGQYFQLDFSYNLLFKDVVCFENNIFLSSNSSIGIYMDTINIFIRILTILASSNSRRKKWWGQMSRPHLDRLIIVINLATRQLIRYIIAVEFDVWKLQ